MRLVKAQARAVLAEIKKQSALPRWVVLGAMNCGF